MDYCCYTWHYRPSNIKIKIRWIDYKNKLIGVLGLGLSGQSAIKYLTNKHINIVAWDDTETIRQRFKKKNISILDLRIIKNLKLTNYLFVSPGINPKHPVLMLAKKYKIEIICDLDIFWQQESNTTNKFIVVTGSNGKSTVTSIIYHLLKSIKYKTILGGNIGIPVLSLKKI